MLYHLFHKLAESVSAFNVVRYITFRSMAAMLTALGISLIFSPWFIRKLKNKQIGQQVRNDGPQSHFSKAGTPTMGGGLILAATLIPALLWMEWTNPLLWFICALTTAYGFIGFLDDYLKVSKKNSKGLAGRKKLLGQFVIAIVICVAHYAIYGNGQLHFPFFKEWSIDLGWYYVPFAVFVIVGSSNAVNLTDGLDGLAIGPVMTTAACFAILAYVGGHVKFAEYLQLHYLKDTGAIAVFTKNEILLVIVGGIFVIEALSVITQVASFKLRGKRIFRMAPIHHHFELKGWPEPRVIVRFWIISIILAIIGLMSLKLR
ncbi:MAG: phospho-N-acetylmuramoyl-pentapeptide-transferase [Proteobacteria bacterium]|nr:phospho-N-acetylmuramoyl-pentapeptide-transferase [Pseudomonadota bacterium]